MNKDIPLESKRATARAYYSTLFVVWLRSNVGHGDQGAKVFDLSGFLRAFAILREKLNLQELIVRDDPLGWEGHPEKVKKEEVIAAFGADDIFRYFRWALSVTKDDVTYRALVDKFQKQLDASVEE